MAHTRKLGYLPPCVAGGWVPLLAHFSILLLLLLSFVARAADPICYEYRFGNGPWKKSISEACTAWGAYEQAQLNSQPGHSWSINSAFVVPGTVCSGSLILNANVSYLVAGHIAGRSITVEQRTVVCEEVCKVGPKGSVNITAGYHATPATNVKLNPLIKADPFVKQLQTDKGATMCYEGCRVGVAPAADGDFWISQVAGPNGLYRSSADVSIQGTSQQCSEASPDAVTRTAPAPACPGSTGSVNGAVVCLPSVSDSGFDMGGEAKRGNPPAGLVIPGKTDKERGEGPGGSGNGTGPAGSNGGGSTGGPATGSNNTPGGKGCNDGSKTPTPACSGKGELDADGTTDKPGEDKEQQACGAPGQPKCRIDETGTPDGKDAFNSAKEKLDSEFDKLTTELDKIKSPDGKDTSWGVMPTWIQTGACSPWNLGTLPIIDRQIKIDICAIKPYVDGVMNFLWALGTFFAVISMVFRVTTNTSS